MENIACALLKEQAVLTIEFEDGCKILRKS
jgi:hypothetical protein